MPRTEITYEHPPGSGLTGCIRTFDDAWILQSDRGDVRADAVVVGDRLQTTPRYKTLVLAVAPEVVEEE